MSYISYIMLFFYYIAFKLFEPGSDDFRRESMSVSKMDMLTKKAVPMDLLFKGPEEQKVSKINHCKLSQEYDGDGYDPQDF